MSGGVVPGGIWRRADCAIAVIWAMAALTDAPCWRKTLMTPMPLYEVDSMCSMSLTVTLMERSWMYTMRGMLMLGKMSVGVRSSTKGVSSKRSSAATTNV